MATQAGLNGAKAAMEETDDNARDGTGGARWQRYLPLGVVALGLALSYYFGLQDYLSLSVLAEKRDALNALVAENRLWAALTYVLVYILAVAFSLPAASLLTVFGGFLFGWLVGGALTAVAATIGATIIFLAARTAFGDVLRKKAGPFLSRLADGFDENAFGYLFVLRLAPVLPFFILNIAPAFFDVRLRTYVLATFFGILPGTFAYSWLGQGLDSVLVSAAAAGREVSIGDLVTPQITLAFAGLALVAAIPTVIRKWRKRAH